MSLSTQKVTEAVPGLKAELRRVGEPGSNNGLCRQQGASS